MAYEHFYRFYDRLMDDVPYDTYLALLTKYLTPGSHLLDLGCGTGRVLVPLLQAGYVVEGLDQSETMLMMARHRLVEAGLNTTLYLDDMREIYRPNHYDGIYSLIDTINYLTCEEDVLKTFRGVYASLKPNGLFIFDVHNKDYIEQVFLDYSYHAEFEDFTYLWDTALDIAPKQTTIRHELVFFVHLKDHLYQRLEEEHIQVAFLPELYRSLLQAAGFAEIDIQSDFAHGISPHATKYQFICRKLDT
ncbi:MAG TPA: class I SAM-dependent methyltransferase [Haloplasmataceae bacterium]